MVGPGRGPCSVPERPLLGATATPERRRRRPGYGWTFRRPAGGLLAASGVHPTGPARVMPGTIAAFLPRLHAASARLGHLVRADADRRIDRGAANVTVVAIQSLHEQAQRFVVGALLRETFKEKEDTGQRLPLSVIVLDELNKYAPRDGTGPLKDMLIDIAQRGRSLGVLLVGAQQTASRVAPDA